MEYLQTEVARLLGVDEGRCDLTLGFTELGLDSLTTVEFRNRLQTALDCSLSSTIIYDYPTLDKLVDYLLPQLFSPDSSTGAVQPSLSSSDLQQVSEADAEMLLIEQLNQLD